MNIKLSKARRQLLVFLEEHGGALQGRYISIPGRRLASNMAADGLVRWERPLSTRHQNLDDWILHIEAPGLEVLARAPYK